MASIIGDEEAMRYPKHNSDNCAAVLVVDGAGKLGKEFPQCIQARHSVTLVADADRDLRAPHKFQKVCRRTMIGVHHKHFPMSRLQASSRLDDCVVRIQCHLHRTGGTQLIRIGVDVASSPVAHEHRSDTDPVIRSRESEEGQMTRKIKGFLLVALFALTALFVLSPANASADSPGTCYPQNPGHFWTTVDIRGQSACTGGSNCVVGHQECEWDCVSNDDGSGKTHPENIVCHSPTWCGNPVCPPCCT